MAAAEEKASQAAEPPAARHGLDEAHAWRVDNHLAGAQGIEAHSSLLVAPPPLVALGEPHQTEQEACQAWAEDPPQGLGQHLAVAAGWGRGAEACRDDLMGGGEAGGSAGGAWRGARAGRGGVVERKTEACQADGGTCEGEGEGAFPVGAGARARWDEACQGEGQGEGGTCSAKEEETGGEGHKQQEAWARMR